MNIDLQSILLNRDKLRVNESDAMNAARRLMEDWDDAMVIFNQVSQLLLVEPPESNQGLYVKATTTPLKELDGGSLSIWVSKLDGKPVAAKINPPKSESKNEH